jgi:hypothetical protein
MNTLHLITTAAWPLQTSMKLGREDLIALELQAGDSLRSDCGTVWLTVDGQPQDVLVDAGELHTVKATGTVNVSALRSARLVVLGRRPLQWHRVGARAQDPIGRGLAALGDRLAAFARRLQSTPLAQAQGR